MQQTALKLTECELFRSEKISGLRIRRRTMTLVPTSPPAHVADDDDAPIHHSGLYDAGVGRPCVPARASS